MVRLTTLTAAIFTVCLASLSMQAVAFSPIVSRHAVNPAVNYDFHSRSRSTEKWAASENHDQEKDLDDTFSLSSISSWANNNKKTLTASAALIAAAAFANPSASLALAEPATIINSATTFMDGIAETGFYQAFSLVFVSEIGDKTFFIAGLLAMKVGRFVSLVGSIGALAVMTIISVCIGQIFHAVPPGISQGLPLDDIAAVIAFAFFGLKTLKDASELEDGDNSGVDEEYEDAVEAVDESRTVTEETAWGKILSTFGLVFAAEFGDRSFISTIALSAAQNPVSVAAGGIAAHAMATIIAVVTGSALAKYISEKTIGYIGGSLFLVFAVTTAFGIF